MEPPYAESRTLVTKPGEFVIQRHEKSDNTINTDEVKTFAELVEKLEKIETGQLKDESSRILFSEYNNFYPRPSHSKSESNLENDDDFNLNNLYDSESNEK